MNDFGYGESTSNFTVPTDSWEAEFHDYVARKSTMSGEMDLIAYWKSQPETPLRIVALQILNVPATSAPVERIFSMCGNPHEQRSSRMLYFALTNAAKRSGAMFDEDCMEMYEHCS